MPPDALDAWLGKGSGRHLHALAHNQDPRVVENGRRAGSVGAQSAFGGSVADPDAHRRVLLRLAERVGSRLRAKGRAARVVTVRLRFADFRAITRRTTLPGPTSSTSAIHHAACDLVASALAEAGEGRGLNLLAISMSALVRHPDLQMELPLEGPDLGDPIVRPGSPRGMAARALDGAVDRAREAFGDAAIARAALLGAHPQQGPTREHLPAPEDL